MSETRYRCCAAIDQVFQDTGSNTQLDYAATDACGSGDDGAQTQERWKNIEPRNRWVTDRRSHTAVGAWIDSDGGVSSSERHQPL